VFASKDYVFLLIGASCFVGDENCDMSKSLYLFLAQTFVSYVLDFQCHCRIEPGPDMLLEPQISFSSDLSVSCVQ
jgi:hypothetical protein